MGVVGLALLSVSAPASAADNFTICHNGHDISIDLNGVKGLGAHSGHPDDIIPPNPLLPAGLNWDLQGMADFANSCEPVTLPPVVVVPPVVPPVVVVPPAEPPAVVPPVVVPPAVVPPVVEPVVVPPVVVPPAVVPPVVEPVVVPPALVETPVTTVTPTVQTPAAPATVQAPAGTGAVAVNQGFNAQTAVGGAESAPTWLAGLGVMLGAGALVAVRRRSLEPKAD